MLAVLSLLRKIKSGPLLAILRYLFLLRQKSPDSSDGVRSYSSYSQNYKSGLSVMELLENYISDASEI